MYIYICKLYIYSVVKNAFFINYCLKHVFERFFSFYSFFIPFFSITKN